MQLAWTSVPARFSQPCRPAEMHIRCGCLQHALKTSKKLADWLVAFGITTVAMESTGVYFALSNALIGKVQVPPALG